MIFCAKKTTKIQARSYLPSDIFVANGQDRQIDKCVKDSHIYIYKKIYVHCGILVRRFVSREKERKRDI